MANPLESRAVLVTGGSGFIGTHLVQALVDAGATVTNLDVRRPILDEHASAWVACDIREPQQLVARVVMAEPDVVYNLAAVADISADASAMAVNTIGLVNVLHAAQALHAPPLVMHFSTQFVVEPGYQPSGPLDLAPYTRYGETKAESERLVHDQGDGLDWVIVRPTMVWGPWHPTFADQVWRYLAKGYYLRPTGRDPRRSYGYVDNVVHQSLRLAELDRNLLRGRTLYLGDEPMKSSIWLDTFSLALRGKPTRRVSAGLLRAMAELGELSRRLGGPSPIDRGRHYRMTTDYAVPMGPTFDLVGPGPVSLDEGVEATVRWMRSRRKGERR